MLHTALRLRYGTIHELFREYWIECRNYNLTGDIGGSQSP
jgi:hypothetical protein